MRQRVDATGDADDDDTRVRKRTRFATQIESSSADSSIGLRLHIDSSVGGGGSSSGNNGNGRSNPAVETAPPARLTLNLAAHRSGRDGHNGGAIAATGGRRSNLAQAGSAGEQAAASGHGSTRAASAAAEGRPQRSTRASVQPATHAKANYGGDDNDDDGSDEEAEFGDDSDDDDDDDDDSGDEYVGAQGSGRRNTRSSKRGKSGASSSSATASSSGRPLRNRSVHEAQSQPAVRSSGRARQATRSYVDAFVDDEDDEDAEGKENGFVRRSERARRPVKTATGEEGEDDDDDGDGRRSKGKKRDRASMSSSSTAAEGKDVGVAAARPHQQRMDPTVKKNMLALLAAMDAADEDQIFAHPVPENEPGYHDMIADPMDLSTARDKVKDRRYSCLEELVGDMHLMLDNCEQFNLESSDFFAAARRLRDVLEETVAKLQ